MRKPYQSYEEIPVLIREYMLTVAEKRTIMEIPLEEINSFLGGLHEYYKDKKEEFSEGWV